MRNIRLFFCLSLLLIGVSFHTSNAQEPAPARQPADAATRPEKIEKIPAAGKAEVTWLEHRKMTVASVVVYLAGEPEDIRQSKDVLQLVARIRSDGKKVTQPGQVEFRLTSYSPQKKYAVEHKLTLIADGQTVLSQDARPTPGSGGSGTEHFQIAVDYAAFAKFANAKRATLKFGGTTIELTPEMSESFKDLDAKIER